MDKTTKLIHAEATDFSKIPSDDYDTVILNSVIQYFPSVEYLLDIVGSALRVIRGQGHIFIGDVRHHQLLEAFHLSVQLHRSPSNSPVPELKARIARQMRTERELLIDPAFFYRLQRVFHDISQVEIFPKSSAYRNEMSAYRYDVILRVRTSPAALPVIAWDDAAVDRANIERQILQSPNSLIGLKNIRNPLVYPDVLALKLLKEGADRLSTAGELQQLTGRQAELGITSGSLASFCAEHGYAMRFSWFPGDGEGSYYALISKTGSVPEIDWLSAFGQSVSEAELGCYGNHPLRPKRSAILQQQLRTHLASALPDYMVPSVYVALDALPLTPHGKLDRKALPAPEGDAYIRRGYEAPQGPVEERLASIWSELLGLERVGRHDNFFECGGHSIMAVQLVSRLRQALNVEVPLSVLFARPVLMDFAAEIPNALESRLPAIVPVGRDGALPLSFAQQRLWFLAQIQGASAAYHIAGGLRLRGKLDRQALQQALDRIVARHEALRTTFVMRDGEAMQRIAAAAVGFALTEHDLCGAREATAELGRLAAEEASAPFNLAQGPLIRGRLVRLVEDEHVLLMTMHHIVSDGWSLGVLTRELSALYAAFARGDQDPLAPLAVQYADYAVWQRQWLSGEVLQRQAAYWKEQLADAPALLTLPADHARPAQADYAGASVEVRLDAPLTGALKALSLRHGLTLHMTLLASFAALLARLSGQDEVVIGSPVANPRAVRSRI